MLNKEFIFCSSVIFVSNITFVQNNFMRLKAFFLCVFAASSLTSFAQKTASVNNGIDRPKLVIGIVVDQMRWDFLYRYYDRYGEGGFKRLIKRGFSFENTMLPYTPAVTAAGHTCLFTGSIPALHGIVGNDWVEKNTGDTLYCTGDKTVQSVGTWSPAGKMSPRNMLVTTVGDELRQATNFKSRVYGIALKDRGGIVAAGHTANAAYWMDDSTGNWISSTYYMQQLPQWVQQMNAEKLPDAFLSKPWNLLRDPEQYDQSIPEDSSYARAGSYRITYSFPHTVNTNGGKNYLGLRATPFGNTITLDFAERLIRNEHLGATGQTDMLCISLSSTDYVGHAFGPQSREVEDTYLRLDKELEDFFSMLDQKFGKDQYLLFLSADHGAGSPPGFLQDENIPGGLLAGKAMLKEFNEALYARYGVKDLLQNYYEYQFFFNRRKINSAQINLVDAEQFVVDLLQKKSEVLTAFSYDQLDRQVLPEFLRKKYENSYFPKRSGDIQMVLKPGYTETYAKGTDHGSAYAYDAHIPLLFYGWNIKPGKTNRETYMTDVAPTIAALLHIQMPSGSVGKVLGEVMK